MQIYATKGIDPKEFPDMQEEDNINFGLRNGLLNDFKPTIRQTKQRIKQGYYSTESLERVIYGPKLTDAQCYAFLQTHCSILTGEILIGGATIDIVPSISAHFDLSPLEIEFEGFAFRPKAATPPERDHELEVLGDITMSRILPCTDAQCDHAHALASEPIVANNPKFILDVGFTSATRTYAYLKNGFSVARWMTNSPHVHLLIPTDTFIKRHRLL